MVVVSLTEKALFKVRRGLHQITQQAFYNKFKNDDVTSKHWKHHEDLTVICLDEHDKNSIVDTVEAFNAGLGEVPVDGVLNASLNVEDSNKLELFYTNGKSFFAESPKKKIKLLDPRLQETPPTRPVTPLYCMSQAPRVPRTIVQSDSD